MDSTGGLDNDGASASPREPQVPSRGTPFESPHLFGEDRGQAPLEEQSEMVSSVTPRGVPLSPDDHAAVATGSPSQPQSGAKDSDQNMFQHGDLDGAYA